MNPYEKTKDDLGMMQHPMEWPKWPVLPIKRIKIDPKSGYRDTECAIMYADGTPRVYLCSMYSLSSDKPLSAIPNKTYPSYNDLVADGWRVD